MITINDSAKLELNAKLALAYANDVQRTLASGRFECAKNYADEAVHYTERVDRQIEAAKGGMIGRVEAAEPEVEQNPVRLKTLKPGQFFKDIMGVRFKFLGKSASDEFCVRDDSGAICGFDGATFIYPIPAPDPAPEWVPISTLKHMQWFETIDGFQWKYLLFGAGYYRVISKSGKGKDFSGNILVRPIQEPGGE